METIGWRWVVWMAVIPRSASATLLPFSTGEKSAINTQDDVLDVLISIVEGHLPPCSYIFFLDGTIYDMNEYGDMFKRLNEFSQSKGLAVLDSSNDDSSNRTRLEHLILYGRQLRLRFSCVTVLVLSDNVDFLLEFAKTSLANRFLAESSKMVVAGRLDHAEVEYLSSHWVYGMLNTLIAVPSQSENQESWEIYTSLPFTALGKQLISVATWSSSKGLDVFPNIGLSPNKFSNFYGAFINITALPYKPYWTKKQHADGEVTYSGSDRMMVEAMASALNFSIYVLPVASWDEVLQRVSDRTSMMATVVHMVLPQRLLRVDFTRTYEHGINIAFGMAKPVLKPQWQSLYYPLESFVWLCILSTLVVTPICFIGVIECSTDIQAKSRSLYNLIIIEIIGTLFGQPLNPRLPLIASTKILLASWLIFAFIVTTAYRSNLMASLIAPRYPPRPENLDQLVKVAERITMPSYGAEFRDYLINSEFESFRALGAMLHVGVSVTEGLNEAVKGRQSHIDGTRYLEQQIAEHFTEANGDSRLYVGREGVLPGLNAYPIPHDAPYKKSFDAVILAVIEVGKHQGPKVRGVLRLKDKSAPKMKSYK